MTVSPDLALAMADLTSAKDGLAALITSINPTDIPTLALLEPVLFVTTRVTL
jgi:hypothetical protein